MLRTPAMADNPDANPPALKVEATQTTGAIFQITIFKLYVPVATLSMDFNTKCLENTKQGFKKTISWNK